MITNFSLFSYDRFLYIMTFRSFDENDCLLSFEILNLVLTNNMDFSSKLNDFFSCWNAHSEGDEWNPAFYGQYIQTHPEKHFFENLKEKCNVPINEAILNTYYGNLMLRCLPVLGFLNSRYIELKSQSNSADNLLDQLNHLYKFHNNPISYVYNTFMYYNNKFQSNNTMGIDMVNRSKKKRLFFILTAQQSVQFSPLFSNYLSQVNIQDLNNPDISIRIDYNYYYGLIQRLNPSCHMLYETLCELISLELFSADPATFTQNVSTNIITMFFIGKFNDPQYHIDDKEFDYWLNAAGNILVFNI
ncbi:mediator of RNA polymerase II transcription subunit 23 isoform X2 [Brachionus plicatilis]|uniref:Mediator of RNA polymerase II transcription subunit 23 n=1 Tax=Brachionus plicatilis TaxID=10195 RepID=A0A3M7RWW0_BRAPC|nr:mediator of RNA polymerase II transcription subunit 23 isoform X2 [Brachionus plicatilis]